MNKEFTNEPDAVLLRCRWRRTISMIMSVVGLIITFAFAFVAYYEYSWGLKFICGCVALLGLGGAVVSIRNVIKPQTLFEATSGGVTMLIEGGGTSLAQPFFIPWERVESMKYEERDASSAGDSYMSKIIALKVRVDEAWSPAEHLKVNYEESTGSIYLDAATGTPHGLDLLRRLKQIKAG